MVWALPERERRRPLIWIAALVIVVGAVIDVTGNLQIVDAIDGASWNDAQTDRLGPSLPGFESGHDLAGLGMSVVVVGAVAFGSDGVYPQRASGDRIGICSAEFVVPTLDAPGFGLIVIVIAVLRASNRRERLAETDVTVP
jgi:drug/metabolite transporter (DMT)-like permease